MSENSGSAPSPVAGPAVLISVNLFHDAMVYVDTYDGAEPILAIDTGVSEIHLSPPTVVLGPNDVAVADALVRASVAYREAVVALASRGAYRAA